MALRTVDIARVLAYEDETTTIPKEQTTPRKEVNNVDTAMASPGPTKFNTYMPTPQRLTPKMLNKNQSLDDGLIDLNTPIKRSDRPCPNTAGVKKRTQSSPPNLRRKSVSFARKLEDTCQFKKEEATNKIQEQKSLLPAPKPKRKSILKMPGSTPKAEKTKIIVFEDEDSQEAPALTAAVEQDDGLPVQSPKKTEEPIAEATEEKTVEPVEEVPVTKVEADNEAEEEQDEEQADQVVSDSEDEDILNESFLSVEEASDAETTARRVSVGKASEEKDEEVALMDEHGDDEVEEDKEENYHEVSEIHDESSLDFDTDLEPSVIVESSENVKEVQDEEPSSPAKQNIIQPNEDSLRQSTPTSFPSIYPSLPVLEEEEPVEVLVEQEKQVEEPVELTDVAEQVEEPVEDDVEEAEEQDENDDQEENEDEEESEDEEEEEQEEASSELNNSNLDEDMADDSKVEQIAGESSSVEDAEQPEEEIEEVEVSDANDEETVASEEAAADAEVRPVVEVAEVTEQEQTQKNEPVVESEPKEVEPVGSPATPTRSRLKRKRSSVRRRLSDLETSIESATQSPDIKRVKLTSLDAIVEQDVNDQVQIEDLTASPPQCQEVVVAQASVAQTLSYPSPNPYSPTHNRRRSRVSLAKEDITKLDFDGESKTMMSPSKVKGSVRLSFSHVEEEEEEEHTIVVAPEPVVEPPSETKVRSRAGRKKRVRKVEQSPQKTVEEEEQPVVEEPPKQTTPIKSRSNRKRRALKEQSPAKQNTSIEFEDEDEVADLRTKTKSPVCSPKVAIIEFEDENKENVTQVRSRKNRVTNRRRQVKV
jgi:hypothetical protein